ncbi:MAG: SRPBCC family protein [Dehalococcoidia bacterium]|jgi:hypothetical protein
MARIEESAEIKRPVDEVFAYTTVASNWPEWHGTISEAEQSSQGKVGIGTTFIGKNRAMGQTSEWTGKVTEYTPNKKWAKILNSGSMIIDDQLIFDPVEDSTKLTMVYDVKVGGFLKLLSPIIINSMRKQLKHDLTTLKSILETKS